MLTFTSPLVIDGTEEVDTFVHELLSPEQNVDASIGLESLPTFALMYLIESSQPPIASPTPSCFAAARAAKSTAACS